MPRNATSAYIQALAEGYLYPCLLLEIYFTSGPIRICTAFQDQFLNGNVYKAMGTFLEVSTIEDGSSVQARGVTVSLSGIDPTLLPEALNDYQVGLPATIYLGLFGFESPNSGALVSDTVVAWQGRTDQPTITPGPDTSTISVNLESLLLDMNTPIPYRYTNQDQQRFFPGDLGFSWVNAIQSLVIYWNQLSNTDGNP